MFPDQSVASLLSLMAEEIGFPLAGKKRTIVDLLPLLHIELMPGKWAEMGEHDGKRFLYAIIHKQLLQCTLLANEFNLFRILAPETVKYFTLLLLLIVAAVAIIAVVAIVAVAVVAAAVVLIIFIYILLLLMYTYKFYNIYSDSISIDIFQAIQFIITFTCS
jgi:hypothetical protein